ncbi:MAG: hypothetical protein JNM94_12865 [Phycisphaerae bacterium]|nr:hypothetical protein [Phycisphaerae bacterium]
MTPAEPPEELPADVREAIATSALELLTGAYAPPDLERARRGWRVAVATLVALVAMLGIVGVLRRGLALDRSIAEADRRRLALVEAAFVGRPGPPGVPAEMRLVAELRELRGTRSGDVPIPFDATDALAALVKVWPEGVELRPESIAVSERGISVRGEAKGHAETQILADALASLEGWRVEAPASRSVKDGVSFTVTLSRDTSTRNAAAMAPGQAPVGAVAGAKDGRATP